MTAEPRSITVTQHSPLRNRYIAGMLAHSKGKSLGMFEDKNVPEKERERRREWEESLGVCPVEAFGMRVPTLRSGDQRLAFSQGAVVASEPVDAYLRRSFGDDLDAVKAGLRGLTASPIKLTGDSLFVPFMWPCLFSAGSHGELGEGGAPK